MSMTRSDLLTKLKCLVPNSDREMSQVMADCYLLDFINDEEVTEAYNRLHVVDGKKCSGTHAGPRCADLECKQ